MRTLETTEELAPLEQPIEKQKKRDQNKQQWFSYFCEVAESKGGRVISTKYERMHSKMDFLCKEGHPFSAKCHDIRQKGTWCPKCAGNERLTIGTLRQVAIDNKGVLLSQAYMGLDIDHMWACSKGHQFSHTPLNVLYNKAWCPICRKEERKAERRKKCFEALEFIAASHEGKLISTEYVNSRSPLKLVCKNEHPFTKSSEKLTQGEWCPYCEE